MALNPVASRGPMVEAGMKYFGGKDARARSKKKGKATSAWKKLSDPRLSPISKFRAHPSHLASPSTVMGSGKV